MLNDYMDKNEAFTRGSGCRKAIEWGELCHLILLQGGLFAYQVIDLVANRGQPWPTVAYRGLPWPTVANRGQPWPTVAYRGLPWPTVAYRGQPWPAVKLTSKFFPASVQIRLRLENGVSTMTQHLLNLGIIQIDKM
jgi:hypothetical protein